MSRFAIILLLSIFFCEPSIAGGSLESACQSYYKHDYSACLQQLDALPASAQSPKSEYYRALCYQALHRYDEANLQFQKLAAQKKDPQIALLSRQGLVGLKGISSKSGQYTSRVAANTAEPNLATKPQQAASNNSTKFVTDNNWKVQEPGFGGAGTNKNGMPENWTFKKTSNGCGRH